MNQLPAAVAGTILIPVGLPSLRIAWLQLPFPMTEPEYKQMMKVLKACHESLTEIPQPPSTTGGG